MQAHRRACARSSGKGPHSGGSHANAPAPRGRPAARLVVHTRQRAARHRPPPPPQPGKPQRCSPRASASSSPTWVRREGKWGDGRPQTRMYGFRRRARGRGGGGRVVAGTAGWGSAATAQLGECGRLAFPRVWKLCLCAFSLSRPWAGRRRRDRRWRAGPRT